MARYLLSAVTIFVAVLHAGVVQATQATISGRVQDAETSELIAGAVVGLTDLDRATLTDGDGRYVLGHVPAGPHRITVHLIGYAQRSLSALVPPDGQLEINISLSPEPLRIQEIEVRGQAIARRTDNGEAIAFPDREWSLAAVRNHPLLAEPDVLEAVGGGEVVLMPESPSGVHIRGGGSDQTAYLLDGIPVFNPYHTAGVFSAWNPDALSRLHLQSTVPSLEFPQTLSGAIAADTRPPGNKLRAQGSLSTTQGRLTLDGPLGRSGAGYVLSLRSGLQDAFARKDEATYVRGETSDWLAKMETPAFGGRLRLLGYDSGNEINAVATAGDAASADPRRNAFEWHSQSLGAEWSRIFSSLSMRLMGWSAESDATAGWTAQTSALDMTAARHDGGLLASLSHASSRATTTAEIRIEESRTSYRVEPDSTTVSPFKLSARTPVAAAVIQHTRNILEPLELRLGTSLALVQGEAHMGPGAELRWKLNDQLTLSGSYARAHQFAQSLRNGESVVGNVFPVDLYMGAGAPEVPVAWSNQGIIAADYRPRAGVRFGLQGYGRASHDLVLVAPGESEPFATSSFTVGSGTARGISADVGVSTARYSIVGSYGLQRVRLDYVKSSYVPDNGTKHLVAGGVTVFPVPTLSLRLGATGALGRRTTTLDGGLEWEACNLLDRGCEFGGSPHLGGEPLGGTALPAYYRVDAGVEKQWQLQAGGRDAVLALFGTATNILGRKNILTYAKDSSTGELVGVEMRPASPLVVGLDWRF